MRRYIPVLAALALSTAAVTQASEIVYFNNGSQLVVQGHSVDTEKDLIRLDLGGGSAVAFPAAMVERIDASGHTLIFGATTTTANRATGGSDPSGGGSLAAGSSNPWAGSRASGPRFKSASERRRKMIDPEQQMAMAGADLYPGTKAPGPAGARMRSLARPREVSAEDPMGTQPAPDGRFQIGTGSQQSARRSYPAFGPRNSALPAAPVNPNDAASNPTADDPGAGSSSGTDAGGGS